MESDAEAIRATLVAKVVLPDIEAESAYFTIKDARKWIPKEIQQQQILAAATAKKPLRRFGITFTNQGGFHANKDQEIHWEWDAAGVERCLGRLDSRTKAVMETASRL